jgi:tetratricopeptide (TPR) repeat protein
LGLSLRQNLHSLRSPRSTANFRWLRAAIRVRRVLWPCYDEPTRIDFAGYSFWMTRPTIPSDSSRALSQAFLLFPRIEGLFMSRLKQFAWLACSVAAVVLSQASVHAQEAAPAEEGQLMRPQEALTAHAEGQRLLEEKKPKEALVQFNLAIAADNTFPEAWLGKGDALKAMDDFASAANAYTQAIDRDPNLAAAYNGRGECFLEVQQLDMASNDFNNALERTPADPKVLSNIGHILVNYSRDAASAETAIRRLDDAILGNPEDARAYRDRGYAHALLREFDKAEADIKKAAEIDPADHENFAVLANIYLFQDDYSQAVDALTKAIAAYKPEKRGDPEIFVAGYTLRADANLKLAEKEKDAKKAEASLQSAIADADAIISKFEKRFPEEGRAYYRKGRAQRMLEQYSDAVNSFTRAVSDVPPGQEAEYMADALMYRGICWYYMGEADLARGDFEQASSTGSGYQDPRIFLWIGFTHHKQGNHRDAINSYGEALAKSPGYALAHVNKGRAYMDLKEYKRAIECFNDAIRSEPDVGENYYNVGFAYMQMKEYQKAADFLRLALLQKDPQPKMFSKMAEALRQLGKNELAEEYERKADEANQKQAASN